MLKKGKAQIIITCLIPVIVLMSCGNSSLAWRSGYLVAQLYSQPNQEILLAYSDLKKDMIVDEQHGYARGYFDNYRKQMIFIRQVGLDYLIGDTKFSTATADFDGYTASVLVNDTYQIGVEIMSYQPTDDEQSQFNGLRSRVIDLNTKKNVIVDGLLFNRCLLIGEYFYGFAISGGSEQFLDIINVRTMKHTRINMTANEISFMYQIGNKLYAQSAKTQKAFLLNGDELINQDKRYKKELPISDNEWQILKDIAPLNSEEHWYVAPGKLGQPIKQVQFVRTYSNGDVAERLLKLKRDDVMQIFDVANYGSNHIAVFYEAKDTDREKWYAFITIYDLDGKEVSTVEIENLRKDKSGRFLYLDYVV